MRDWLSARDLAALALPGLPATERGWRDHAAREGWFAAGKARARSGRGGGFEFHIDLLPAAGRAAYVTKYIGAARLEAADAAEAGAAEALAPLTAAAQEILGEIGADRCLDEQRMKHVGTSAIRTALFHACRSGDCPHSRIATQGGAADAA